MNTNEFKDISDVTDEEYHESCSMACPEFHACEAKTEEECEFYEDNQAMLEVGGCSTQAECEVCNESLWCPGALTVESLAFGC